MNESDAKEKWCPMARFGVIDGEWLDNRGRRFSGLCIGSECMMWIGYEIDDHENYPAKIPVGDCGLKSRIERV